MLCLLLFFSPPSHLQMARKTGDLLPAFMFLPVVTFIMSGPHSNGTSHSWDKFVSFSIRSNFNYKIGKNPAKGVFIGGGFGFQNAKDECVTVTQNGLIKEENVHYDAIKFGAVMLTFNAGYIFPLKKNKSIQTVISIIGPQTAKDYLGTYLEAVSLMNAGVRVVL